VRQWLVNAGGHSGRHHVDNTMVANLTAADHPDAARPSNSGSWVAFSGIVEGQADMDQPAREDGQMSSRPSGCVVVAASGV
jgi:hypothetical protein